MRKRKGNTIKPQTSSKAHTSKPKSVQKTQTNQNDKVITENSNLVKSINKLNSTIKILSDQSIKTESHIQALIAQNTQSGLSGLIKKNFETIAVSIGLTLISAFVTIFILWHSTIESIPELKSDLKTNTIAINEIKENLSSINRSIEIMMPIQTKTTPK